MTSSARPRPQPTVLIVEDDLKLSRLLCRALRLDGFDVHAVADGLDALDHLRDRPYEAVVLDLGLPGVDGLSVCNTLRRNGSTVPILILTARDGMDDIAAGMQAGATDYLVKPVDLRTLAARIAAVADGTGTTV